MLLSREKLMLLQSTRYQLRNICFLYNYHDNHNIDYLTSTNGLAIIKNDDEQSVEIETNCSNELTTLFFVDQNDFQITMINDSSSPLVQHCDGVVIWINIISGINSNFAAKIKMFPNFEKISKILLLDGLDQLIYDEKISPSEAFTKIKNIVKEVNELHNNVVSSNNSKETHEYFCPSEGNVLFAATKYHFAFGLRDFAIINEKKLGIAWFVLEKLLWNEDIYYSKKEKYYKNNAIENKKCPIFVQLILDNIWFVFKNANKVKEIVNKLAITLDENVLKIKDHKLILLRLFEKWLPANEIILKTIRYHIPEPSDPPNQEEPQKSFDDYEKYSLETQKLFYNFLTCCQYSENVIIILSKTIELNEHHKIAIGKVYSGTLKTNDELFIIPKNYSNHLQSSESLSLKIESIIVLRIWKILAHSAIIIKEAPAGNIIGVTGAELLENQRIILSNNKNCPYFNL